MLAQLRCKENVSLYKSTLISGVAALFPMESVPHAVFIGPGWGFGTACDLSAPESAFLQHVQANLIIEQ